MEIWFWVIAAVVAGWMVQLWLTLKQATAFNKMVVALRSAGVVSVGVGGKRYRGGRAYVAMALDDTGVVTDAITLQGFTTFARGRALPALRGSAVRRIAGDGDLTDLTRPQRAAARQAAELYLQGHGAKEKTQEQVQRRGEGVTTSTA